MLPNKPDNNGDTGDACGPRFRASHRASFAVSALRASIAIACLALGGCAEPGWQNDRNIPENAKNGGIKIWRDPESRCAYLLISEDYAHLSRAAITPRLSANGTPDCPAAGIEARQGGNSAGGSVHESPVPEGAAPTPEALSRERGE